MTSTALCPPSLCSLWTRKQKRYNVSDTVPSGPQAKDEPASVPTLGNGLQLLPDGSLVSPVPAILAARYERRDAAAVNSHSADERTPTEQDRDRLAYSPFLRRLAGVTQVVSPELQTARFHSRASHTHKVALLAREIAEHIVRKARTDDKWADVILRAGGLDIAAAEAAGLAHDLGHPPFGHAGERVLNAKLIAAGVAEGFEGNAQSFRIVTVLEAHKLKSSGLDLTNVTLAAILKYPWRRDLKKSAEEPTKLPKFGAYVTEQEELWRARDAVYPGNSERTYDGKQDKPRQSLEASIMDLADDIGYSIHDLEDFWAEGVFDIDRVQLDLDIAIAALSASEPIGEGNQFGEAMKKLVAYEDSQFNEAEYLRSLSWLHGFIGRQGPQSGNAESATRLLKDKLNGVVGDFFGAIEVDDSGARPMVTLETKKWHLMQVLKAVTKHYFVTRSRMGTLQQSQHVVISELFDALERWMRDSPDLVALPRPLQIALDRAHARIPAPPVDPETHLGPEVYRAISDYICGMSDSEALMRSQWLRGNVVPGVSSLGVVS